tara:strand:+ start:626 stop:784 length:159 start_codon:yes stop_codon:yes gene_type:complete
LLFIQLKIPTKLLAFKVIKDTIKIPLKDTVDIKNIKNRTKIISKNMAIPFNP